MLQWRLLFGLLGLVLAACAQSANTTNAPILQIDNGGHTSLIRDIAFTRDGRYLVSARGDGNNLVLWNI